MQENGLTDYRIYLDTHLTNCSEAHSRLDQIIDNRCEPVVGDSMWVRTRLKSFGLYPVHPDSLVDAHYWSKSGGDVVLIRDGDRAGYDHSELRNALLTDVDRDTQVLSPEEVASSIS